MALYRCGNSSSNLPNEFKLYGYANDGGPLVSLGKEMADNYTQFKCNVACALILDGQTSGTTINADTWYNIADYTFTTSIGTQPSGSPSTELTFKK